MSWRSPPPAAKCTVKIPPFWMPVTTPSPNVAWTTSSPTRNGSGALAAFPPSSPPSPQTSAGGASSVVIAEAEGGHIGLVVDALLGQREAVLKPLLRPFDQVPGLSAVTVLASGRPVFILDVPRLHPA